MRGENNIDFILFVLCSPLVIVIFSSQSKIIQRKNINHYDSLYIDDLNKSISLSQMFVKTYSPFEEKLIQTTVRAMDLYRQFF